MLSNIKYYRRHYHNHSQDNNAAHTMTMVEFSVAALLGGVLISNIFGVESHKLAGRHMVQRGNPGAEALIQKARRYMKNGSSHHSRRLEFDGSYNIQFSQCVDIKLLDDDLFGDDVIEYTKAGEIISTKSYVLFHVCQDGDCGSGSEDDLYLLDLSTYVKNMASYHASTKSAYCDACDTYYYDFCVSQAAADDDAVAAAANDDAAANYEGDDAARKLVMQKDQRSRSLMRYITCDQCEAYGCKGDNDVAAADTDEAVVDIIDEISACLNTGVNWNGNNMYVGFMCSPYGDGVELAIFLDDQCTVYSNQKSFADIPSYYIYNSEDAFTMAEAHIKSAFTETTSCVNEEFGDPANESSESDDAVDQEVNGYCASIFQSELVAFNSCAQDDDQSNNYQNSNQNDDENFAFYEYDMKYEELGEIDEVCTVFQLKGGEYTYNYDIEKSGTWNNHASGTRSSNSGGTWYFLTDDGNNATAISLYVILGIVVIVLVFFAIWEKERRRRERMTEPIYKGSSFGRLV